MFEIVLGEEGRVSLSGRFDAAQVEEAQSVLDAVNESSVLDFAQLEYISSAGLGLLLKTQKRLMGAGGSLTLINVNKHINDVFRYSGFDQIFEIRPAGG